MQGHVEDVITSPVSTYNGTFLSTGGIPRHVLSLRMYVSDSSNFAFWFVHCLNRLNKQGIITDENTYTKISGEERVCGMRFTVITQSF